MVIKKNIITIFAQKHQKFKNIDEKSKPFRLLKPMKIYTSFKKP